MKTALFTLLPIVAWCVQAGGAEIRAAMPWSNTSYPIRINHAGYLPQAAKWCMMRRPPCKTFLVQKGRPDVTWETVYEGVWQKAPSGDDVMLGDFSSITEPGDYRILCGPLGTNETFRMPNWRPWMQSFHFPIRPGVYDVAERMMLTYVAWQRCGSSQGWAGPCHQDLVPLKDAAGRTVRLHNMRGGYHQSCDLRCWHDGISMSLYALLRYAELEKTDWGRTAAASELRWGCDYFLKAIGPEGYVYDAQFAPIGWGPRTYYLAPATLGAQCNTVMLFARAAIFFRSSDAAYADRLLEAARTVWRQIETHPFFEKPQPAPEKNLPPGAQPAERCYPQQYRTSVNGLSERAVAALELYRATREAAYGETAKRLGHALLAHLVRTGEKAGHFLEKDGRPAFKDWSYCWRVSGERAPLELWKTFPDDAWRDAALCLAERRVRHCRATNMFPGTPPRYASSSRAASDALYLAACARLFDRPDLAPWAQRCFDWIFGANNWNASYVEGVGQNQWQRPVFGQFFPSTPQLPGAVLHVDHGEYDMPPTALTLWTAAALEQLWSAAKSATSRNPAP